jgi:hypothetical protein
MKRCGNCGFPAKLADSFEWRGDGTIISTDRTRTKARVAILEVREFERLFSDLSDAIGFSIDSLLITAQKNIGKQMYASLTAAHVKGLPTNRLFRPQFLAKLLARLVARDAGILGGGTPRVVSYKAGRQLVLRFINPVVVPRVVGNALGIYESVEEMPSSRVEYHMENGDLIITMSHGGEGPEPEATRRLYLEEITPSERNITYARCGSCNVPTAISEALEWDIGRGTITNRKTGRREVVVAVQSTNAILRELESELGEDVPRLIYENQKAYTLDSLRGATADDRDAFWQGYLEDLALRGLGYPSVFESDDRGVYLEISNAYTQDLYAARIAAALEALTGKASEVEWMERQRDYAAYRIRIH